MELKELIFLICIISSFRVQYSTLHQENIINLNWNIKLNIIVLRYVEVKTRPVCLISRTTPSSQKHINIRSRFLVTPNYYFLDKINFLLLESNAPLYLAYSKIAKHIQDARQIPSSMKIVWILSSTRTALKGIKSRNFSPFLNLASLSRITVALRLSCLETWL